MATRICTGEPQRDGKRAEINVGSLLRNLYKRHVSVQDYYAPFDLLVDKKWRVEVKCANCCKDGDIGIRWFFNFHRHGVLDERNVDLYILRLEKVPYQKAAIHLLFVAPLDRMTLSVSFRSLLNQHAENVAAFYRFAKDGVVE